MYTNRENWAEIRRRVLVDGLSKRAACREYDVHWATLTKNLDHPEPPGYGRTAPPRHKPKIDPFLGVIHRILEGDKKDTRATSRPPVKARTRSRAWTRTDISWRT